MVLNVKRAFRDRETGIVYNPGDVAEFTGERAAVILADHRGLAEVKPTEEEAKPERKSRKKKQ